MLFARLGSCFNCLLLPRLFLCCFLGELRTGDGPSGLPRTEARESNMRRYSERNQQTLQRSAEVTGIGYLTGAQVRLRFLPAPPNTGVVFVRTDLRPIATVHASVENVTGTARRTTLGHPPVQIGLIEHVLAALAGLHIDNCRVELNAPEPPGMDGSAQAFVEAVQSAGTEVQSVPRGIWTLDGPVSVSQPGATLTLHPSERPGLTISYFLDYGPNTSLGRQCHTQVITPQTFPQDIATSRTFILESEVAELRKQGLGARTTPADLLVFGPQGPIKNYLRHANEPARHKILDIVGDLALLGVDLQGHVVAYRSGHPLNVELVRTLRERMVAPQCCARAA